MNRHSTERAFEDTLSGAHKGISDPGRLAIAAWQPFRGPFQRWPRVMDTLLAALAFCLTMMMWLPFAGQTADSLSLSTLSPSEGLALILAVLGNFSLVWRRRYPIQVHAVIVACTVLVLMGPVQDGLFATAFSLYSLGRYAAHDRVSLLGMLATLLVAVVDMFMLNTSEFGSVIAGGMIILLWYIGRRLRFRGEHLRLLEERAEFLERSRSVEAQRAVAEERTRIAREMHDVVAHQISLMTVQAGAAKTVAASNPGAAIAAMAAVEGAGRQALSEMRHLLDVLRPDRSEAALAPQPGLKQLTELVQEVRDAGTPVQLNVNSAAISIPGAVDLALYRIVQESLTNVLKHAGKAARVTVQIDVLDEAVELRVRDTGESVVGASRTGHGIAGMRERAELLGGWLQAGPAPLRGFEVHAVLPLIRSNP